MFDIGIYCLNAARYLFRSEPEEVFAWTARNGEKRFEEVEEMSSAVLRFPSNRLAAFTCSFGSAKTSSIELVGTEASLRLSPAYGYTDDIEMEIHKGEKTKDKSFKATDQFAAELDYFARCIMRDEQPEPSGEEGLTDVRIIQAMYRSPSTNMPVKLDLPTRRRRPQTDQEISRPASEAPEPVHAAPPGGK